MAKQFSDIRLSMTIESQSRAHERTDQLLADIPVKELRQARSLSQTVLAETLNVQQSSILELEKQADIYLSVLRAHIQAIGGELEIIARFPHGSIYINSFSDLENAAGSSRENRV